MRSSDPDLVAAGMAQAKPVARVFFRCPVVTRHRQNTCQQGEVVGAETHLAGLLAQGDGRAQPAHGLWIVAQQVSNQPQ